MHSDRVLELEKIIELQNSVCLAISEEIDNPMLRVYSDRKEAMQSIIEQQRKNTEFYI